MTDLPLHLAFYRGRDHGRRLDRLVAAHDHGRHSHVELVFGPLAGAALCFSSSWRDGGARFKRVRLRPGRFDLLPVPATDDEAAAVRRWCAARVGGRYDLPGVLAFKLPAVRHRLHWWFCSEICCAALQQVGRLPGVRAAALSPNTLYREWEGELRCTT